MLRLVISLFIFSLVAATPVCRSLLATELLSHVISEHMEEHEHAHDHEHEHSSSSPHDQQHSHHFEFSALAQAINFQQAALSRDYQQLSVSVLSVPILEAVFLFQNIPHSIFRPPIA